MSNVRKMASAQAAKAYVAALIAAGSAATVAADNGITTGEAISIAVAALVAFQATYWTTNTDAPLDVEG